MTAGPPGPDDYASRVLDVVDSIAPGSVMSYGDVAEFLGAGGPRQVGRVMALWGGGVAWWRVVHADGSLLAGHERTALARYRAEHTPLRAPAAGGTPRVDMRRARFRPSVPDQPGGTRLAEQIPASRHAGARGRG
jgi:alkylated DNA nucleotide flippase Atl1